MALCLGDNLLHAAFFKVDRSIWPRRGRTWRKNRCPPSLSYWADLNPISLVVNYGHLRVCVLRLTRSPFATAVRKILPRTTATEKAALLKCHSAVLERSARPAVVLLLHHGGVADEFSENRHRIFASRVEPINTYVVVVVGVFRNLERFGRPAVVEFYSQ